MEIASPLVLNIPQKPWWMGWNMMKPQKWDDPSLGRRKQHGGNPPLGTKNLAFSASKNWPWRPWFHLWCHAWRIMQRGMQLLCLVITLIPISGLPWKTVVPIQGQRMGKSGGQSVWIPFYNDPKNETNKQNTEMLSKYLGIFPLEDGWTWALSQCFNGD